MKILIYCWVHVITHLSKPIDSTTVRVSSDVNYGLWVTMIQQRRFINCHKGTTVVGNIDSGGDYACMGAGSIWEPCSFCLILLWT